jgi:hypothetical protein
MICIFASIEVSDGAQFLMRHSFGYKVGEVFGRMRRGFWKAWLGGVRGELGTSIESEQDFGITGFWEMDRR